MIDGVLIKPLKQIVGDRGRVMHMLKSTDENFEEFGEIYFSTAPFGVIKDWHIHKSMTLNYAVVFGLVKLVLYDGRAGSRSFGEVTEIYLGDSNYNLVKIPPGVANAFKGLSVQESILANCATQPHSDGEITRMPPNSQEIPYDWSKTN